MSNSVSSEYKQRLSDWVVSEMKRTNLSERRLADEIGVNFGALQKWRKQQLKQGLKEDSIAAIARWRCESPADVRAWLEGKKSLMADALVEQIRVASVPVLLQAMRLGLQRLEDLLLELEEVPAMCTVVHLILHELEMQKISRAEFAEQAGMKLERLEKFMANRSGTDEDLEAIARGLSFGKVKWTGEQLKALVKQQGDACKTPHQATIKP